MEKINKLFLAATIVSMAVIAVFASRAYAPIPTPILDGRSYLFAVEIDGVIVGGFREVSGLSSETEVIEVQEGGENAIHKIPGRTRWSNIVLKRGVTHSDALIDWITDIQNGENARKNGSIIMYNQDGNEIVRYNFFNAFPVKWIGPTLDATKNEVAIETIEIAHEGLTIQ